MHELSITQHMLEICLRHAEQNHATRITQITLVIGELSSFVDDSIQFYWDTISDGTLAKGAKLIFERVMAQLKCESCGTIYAVHTDGLLCPSCGSHHTTTLAGTEFYVASIDIDLEEEPRA